jgi:hypothetical protein
MYLVYAKHVYHIGYVSENCAYCIIHSYERHVHWNWRVFITIMEQHGFQTLLRKIDNWEPFVRTVLLVKGCSEEVQIINYTKLPPWEKKKVFWRVQNEDILVPFIEVFKISSYKPKLWLNFRSIQITDGIWEWAMLIFVITFPASQFSVSGGPASGKYSLFKTELLVLVNFIMLCV